MMNKEKKKKRKYDYFTGFERQVELACQEAALLTHAIETFQPNNGFETLLVEAHEIEHQGDEVTHTIFTAIATDFITPIEREDIVALAQYFDDILDYIEDVIQRFHMYDVKEMHEDALEFAHIIEKSCQALSNTMSDFRNFKKSKNFKQKIIDVNTYEEEADELYMGIIRHLYENKKDDPLYILTWSQLFTRMEKCTDACEHAADTMRMILLKNS